MVDTTAANLQMGPATDHSTRSVYGWMLRQYYEYLYKNVTRQFWRIPEPPTLDDEMDGSVAVMNGAASGIGLETARQSLIRATPRMLIVTAIDENDLCAMNEELCGIAERRTSTLRTNICAYVLHLHGIKSVQNFAKKVQSLTADLDILLLNAGIVTSGWGITQDDPEGPVQVNYMSNVMLALLLLPMVKRTSLKRLLSKHIPRITFVGSDRNMAAGLPFEYHPSRAAQHTLLEHLRDLERFNEGSRYADTKLLILLFVRELTKHTKVLVNCVHPGYMATELFRTN